MFRAFIGAAGLIAFTLASASADEVYATHDQDSGQKFPDMIYEDDIDGDAVWVFEGGGARFYIEGMAGVHSGRTSYSGWYVLYQSDEPPCRSGSATDHLGNSARHWGYLQLDWVTDDAFVLQTGECNDAVGTAETIVGVNVARQPTDPPVTVDTQRDIYDFDNALLVVALNQVLPNDFDGYVSYTKTVPLHRGGAELTVSVQVITDNDYHMIEFMTSGEPSLDSDGGLGYSMGLWPYSSVWNLQRNTQTIYAAGEGLERALEDLEIKFNGAQGRVDFSATGDAADGSLVLTMQNK